MFARLRTFRFDWKLTLLTTLLLPLLLSLGFWQLDRLDQRRAQNSRVLAARNAEDGPVIDRVPEVTA